MKLHEDDRLFRQAIQFTAQQMKIPDIYIEKDYWVTYVLHIIFHHAIGQETIFKGGTALSKCYGLIDRFSEDIDLVVIRKEDESNNQMTRKIQRISNLIDTVLPQIDIQGLTRKMGMNRKTAHTYSKRFSGEYGQVKDVILIEATWLGNYEPYTTRPVHTYVYDMMLRTNQKSLADAYGMQPFNVQTLAPQRTLCEKIMSLVRFSHTDNPIESLKKKIRHIYDLHQLLNQPDLLHFFQSSEFDSLLLSVGSEDLISFKNNNAWLSCHPKDALIFSDILTIWNTLKITYHTDFKNLVFWCSAR